MILPILLFFSYFMQIQIEKGKMLKVSLFRQKVTYLKNNTDNLVYHITHLNINLKWQKVYKTKD